MATQDCPGFYHRRAHGKLNYLGHRAEGTGARSCFLATAFGVEVLRREKPERLSLSAAARRGFGASRRGRFGAVAIRLCVGLWLRP
jgi:hypothetical protein